MMSVSVLVVVVVVTVVRKSTLVFRYCSGVVSAKSLRLVARRRWEQSGTLMVHTRVQLVPSQEWSFH